MAAWRGQACRAGALRRLREIFSFGDRSLVGWAKRSVPTTSAPSWIDRGHGASAPLPTLRFLLTLPWRGRVGTRSSEARCVTGWGDLSTRALFVAEGPSPRPARAARDR